MAPREANSIGTDQGPPPAALPPLTRGPSHHGPRAGDAPRDPDSWGASLQPPVSRADLLRELSRSCPQQAARRAEGLAAMPAVGSTFLGFHLIAELGRGAFGRVFLARQHHLADRPVALKVSTEMLGESQKLAQLQHTHIVPIYSLHSAGALQAACMPYFGSTTLADVIQDLQKSEALPESGKNLVGTLHQRSRRTRQSLDSRPGPAADVTQTPPPVAPAPALPAPAAQTLQMLEGLSYVDAVLWIASALADGLAHAHERGILHRDLKPANVLLTDEGQPMLLDFNLSEDVKARPAVALIGGTLPYMAPEHLEAFQGKGGSVDARSDLYSLGVIVFELLTGRHPFSRPPGSLEEVLPRMVEERRRPPPALRPFNPAATPAVEAIVRRCLEPDPARRYQTARQLHEDLERHRNHQPLLHTREPSWRERAAKWMRRHPRLASSGTVAAVAAVLLLLGVVGWEARGRHVEQLEAADGLARFRAEAREAKLLLSARTTDRTQEQEGLQLARQALQRYRPLDDPAWRQRPAFRALPEEERNKLPGDLGDLLLLLAQSAGRAGGEAGLEEALWLNRAAEDCFGADAAPQALWAQRARLLEGLRQADEARRAQERADRTPPRDGWDHYLQARDLADRGRVHEALDGLRRATRQDPANAAAWRLMGNCCLDGFGDRFGREADAVAHYTTCIALHPDHASLYLNRGVAYLRQHQAREAEADFTRALELRPELAEGYLHRGKARRELGRDHEALADYTQALEEKVPGCRIYFLRARLLWRLGDRDAARADWKAGVEADPGDDENFVARGVARLEPLDPARRPGKADVEAALADFEAAVRYNPRSLAGLHNQAHVLGEHLGRTEEAVKQLDRLLQFYPEFVAAYGGRGVLRARLGRRDEAHADAEQALARDQGGFTLFQVAGVYALTSRGHPEDKEKVFPLLARALQKGFGYEHLEGDPDLEPVRRDPRFQELRQAVGAVNRAAAPLNKVGVEGR
jgi:serine/threonine protein kinase/Flp pilus assembly protein TadD